MMDQTTPPDTTPVRPQARLPWWARVHLVWVLLAAWLIGSAAMINSVVNRTRFNALPEWAHIRSWAAVFAVILGLGLLRGALDYALGGLWVRLKLLLCGVRGGQWGTSTRLFCITRLPEQLASLGLLVYFALRYDDLPAFIAQPLGLGNLIAAGVMLATPFLTYFAARSAYSGLRPVWTAVLFFVIPMLWRGALVLFLLVKILFPGFLPSPAPLPDVEHPRRFASTRFVVDYPSNWGVEDKDPDDLRIEISAGRGSASTTIWVARIDGPGVVEADLKALGAQGFQAKLIDEQDGITLGSQTGYGLEYELTNSGARSRMFYFIMQMGPEHLAVFRYQASDSDWNNGKLAIMQMIDSIEIIGFSDQHADLDHARHVERDWFECEIPGNWKLTDQSHKQYRSFVVQPEQGGRFWCSIFDRPITPQKELDTYIEYSLWSETIERRQDLSSFFGLGGVGVDLVCREPLLGKQRVRAVYVPLEDGRVMGIRVERPQHSATMMDPGFDLIERTFKLRGVEPAKP